MGSMLLSDVNNIVKYGTKVQKNFVPCKNKSINLQKK